MDEIGTARVPAFRIWLKRAGIAFGLLVLLLVVFHRPLLLTIGRRAAIHFAAAENLKLDCRLEGSVFGSLIIRNLRVVPTGPSLVESLDADYIRADYSLLDFFRHGTSELLKNIEVRNVTAVLDPAKAPPTEKPKKPNERSTLPAIFPDRILISDVSVLMRSANPSGEFALEHCDLDLNPNAPGELRIRRLQVPSVPAWSNLSAQTSYTKKDLRLSGLALDGETQLRQLELNASEIKEKKLALALDLSLGGGSLSASAALSETATSLQMQSHVVAEKIVLEKLRSYIGPAADGFSGTVNRVEIAATGALDTPRSWTATINADVTDLKTGAAALDQIALQVKANNGVAQIEKCEVTRGPNKFSITGNATLPESVSDFGRAPASLQISGSLPDLHELTAETGQAISGAATIEGRADIVDATLRTALKISSGPLTWSDGSADSITALITASRKMPAAKVEKPYYSDLESETHFELANIRSGEYAVDSISAVVKSANDLVTLERADVTRASNAAHLHGTYRLPVDFAQARMQPGDVQIDVNAKELGEFWASDAPSRVTGPLQIDGEIGMRDGIANGELSVYGANLRTRNLNVPLLSSRIAIWKNVVYLNDLTASLNERDFIRANGTFAVDKPYKYTGTLATSIEDLSTLKPVLEASGNKSELAGTLTIDWRGSGEAADFKNNGDLKLKLEHGRFGDLQKLQANVDANYSPNELNVPIVFFSSDKVMLQAVMQAKGSTLEMTKIQLDQGEAKYASGYVSIPFVWANLGSDRPLLPADGNVLINFQTENLDLQKLAKDFGQTAPMAGAATVKLDAQGTLRNLRAAFDLQLTGLHSESYRKFEPARFGLNARIENNKLIVDGKLEQARIQPVQISASMPMNLSRVVEEKKLDETSPISGSVKMPRSSINFVREFVPALERVDGDLALDVSVNGTIAKPQLSGSADMKINVARFSNATIPALSNFTARLAFAGETLSLEQFRGELAGGPFTLSGRITFPKLTEPRFDLQLKADAILLARNDDLTARADMDIRVEGPLAGANVTGNVAITNSQFFKNIDLIPIGLPGRPAPGPKPPSDAPDLSFPNPPLRDWKFDLAIKTKDPFMIRGNLANGGALVDMKISGTGLQPKIDGSVRLQNVEATLPFSRLEIQQGFVYFNPADPMNPGIDLQGTSLIRDYTVRVYVYGTANQPEAVFTSEPPLPQEEIISLLATGTTRAELLSGGNALAGRALMLLGQELYRKVFKKGQSTKPNSFFDKLQVDVGNTDPKTGQQTATARYRVNEKVQLIGDIGVQGDFRGTVKYLIRFR